MVPNEGLQPGVAAGGHCAAASYGSICMAAMCNYYLIMHMQDAASSLRDLQLLQHTAV